MLTSIIGQQKEERDLLLSKNLGKLLENLVFVELLRRDFSAIQSLFYYRTRNDKEIDFVCRQANQVSALIQVSYDISASKTLKREVSALIEASDELNCQDLIILTWYSEQIIEESNKKIYDSIATSRMRATSQDDYAF